MNDTQTTSANGAESPEKAAAELRKLQGEADKSVADARKAEADAKKAATEAEKAALDAAFPKGATKPLEGNVEADEKSGYVAELVAYEAMKTCAEKIAVLINQLSTLPNNARILLVDSLDFATGDLPLLELDAHFDILNKQLEQQDEVWKKLEEPGDEDKKIATMALIPALVAGVSAAGQLADLVGYLRSDYTIKGRAFSISNTALQAAVAGKITRCQVFIHNFQIAQKTAIVTRFQGLVERRYNIERLKEEVLKTTIAPKRSEKSRLLGQIAGLEKELEKEKDPEKREHLEGLINAGKAALKEVEAALSPYEKALLDWLTVSGSFDSYMKAIVSPGDKQGPALLAAAALREQAQNATHLLYLMPASSGGDQVLAKNLIPWWGGKASYLGGAAMSFVLAEKEGRILAADTYAALSRVEYHLASGSTENMGRIDLSRLEA